MNVKHHAKPHLFFIFSSKTATYYIYRLFAFLYQLVFMQQLFLVCIIS